MVKCDDIVIYSGDCGVLRAGLLMLDVFIKLFRWLCGPAPRDPHNTATVPFFSVHKAHYQFPHRPN